MSDAGLLLRSARVEAGLSQADLARRLKVSQPAIAKLESPRSNPSVETLDRAIRATGHRLELRVTRPHPGVDESLIRRHLELAPSERLRGLETMYEEARRLAAAGARSRGELA